MPTIVCRICNEEKPAGEFGKWSHQCKRCLGRRRRDRERNDPEVAARRRLSHHDADRKRRLSRVGWCQERAGQLRRACMRHSVPCDLTAEDLLAVFPANEMCPALGVRFRFGKQSDFSPSIDRIFPDRGYLRGNVAIISKRANAIKNNASAAEIMAVASWATQAESQARAAA